MTNVIRTLPLTLALLACFFLVTGCKNGDGNDTAVGTAIDGTLSGGTAASLLFTWDAPTANTDGTSLTLAGYKIYYGASEGFYTNVVDLSSTETTTDISGLFTGVSGTYYFAVTAYDADGNESDFSNEVSRYVGP